MDQCFVMMPIGKKDDSHYQEFRDVYEFLIKKPIEGAFGGKLKCFRVDQSSEQGSIVLDIIRYLATSRVAVADLTHLNANVFYELGVRHALVGNSVMIAQDIEGLPFDIRDYRILQYGAELRASEVFKEKLIESVDRIMNSVEIIDNPVQHYIRHTLSEKDKEIKGMKEEITTLRRRVKNWDGTWPIIDERIIPYEFDGETEVKHYRSRLNKKTLVVDDDPGGMHAMTGVPFFLDLDKGAVQEALSVKGDVAYLITNSRSHFVEDAIEMNGEVGRQIGMIAKQREIDISVISRGDSTLRGHYPSEVDSLRRSLEGELGYEYTAELFIPAYIEAGRVTYNGVHYVKSARSQVPVGLTDYAKDKTFGFTDSYLGDWLKNKLRAVGADEKVVGIGLQELRDSSVQDLSRKIASPDDFTRFFVDALNHDDVEKIACAAMEAEIRGARIFYRSAPSFVRAFSGRNRFKTEEKRKFHPMIPRLTKDPRILVICGSITDVSRAQRLEASQLDNIESILIDVKRIYNPYVKDGIKEKIKEEIGSAGRNDQDILLYTSEYYAPEASSDLAARGSVLNFLSEITSGVAQSFDCIITKGSDTGFLIMRNGLSLRKGYFEGIVSPGIGLCQVDVGGEKPMPLFLFVGNAGNEGALAKLIMDIRESFKKRG